MKVMLLADVEAILLTGGASSRMGKDKARLRVNGAELAPRIASKLQSVCNAVTILGRDPIDGLPFLPDRDEFAGPLAALARFVPSQPFVFVSSCDLVQFDPAVVGILRERIGTASASIPVSNAKLQPLCALYEARCWAAARATIQNGAKSIMAWVDQIQVVEVDEQVLIREGVSPAAIMGANTQEEFDELMNRQDLG